MEKEQKITHQSEDGIFQASPKVTFYLGLLSGITLVSVIGFFLTFSMLRSGSVVTKNTNSGTNGTVAGADTNTNTAAAPAAAPTAPVDIKLTADDHVKGNANAKVTLVEYSDFQCPFCATVRPTLDQVMKDYGDKVKLVYRNYPLTSLHPMAQKAAEASECASEQGKFWEMHDKLFDQNTAGTMSVDNFKKAAGELKLNQSQFDTCLDTGKYASKVTASETEGTSFGVQGTPATFVNGVLISGAVPYAQFKTAIDNALSS